MNFLLATVTHVDNLLWCELITLGLIILGLIASNVTDLKRVMKRPLTSSTIGAVIAILSTTVLIDFIRINGAAPSAIPTLALLIASGILTFGGTLLLLKQKTLKRGLMVNALIQIGLLVFMIGVGPAGTIPAFFHLGAFVIALAGLFFTIDIVDSTDAASRPYLRALFGVLLAGLLGAPLSGTFAADLIAFGYGLQYQLLLTLGIMLASVVSIIALIRLALPVLVMPTKVIDAAVDASVEETPSTTTKRQRVIAIVIFGASIAIVFGLGIFLLTAQGIQAAVELAQNVIQL